MRHAWTIAGRELRGYLDAPLAYVVLVLYLVVTSIFFFYLQGFFVVGEASLDGLFGLLPWTLVFFVPPLTMRLFAEERKLGTDEVLLTLPVADAEVVAGKFLGAYGFVAAMLTLTISLPLTVAWLGDPDPGPILGGYAGGLLLAGAYVAIGLWASSLSDSQIVACIGAGVVLVGLILLGADGVLTWLPEGLVPAIRYASLQTHFDALGRGVVDSRDVVYYLSVIAFFLALTTWSLEERRR